VLRHQFSLPHAIYIEATAPNDEWRSMLQAERDKKTSATIFRPVGKLIADGTSSDDDLLFAEAD
jgi:aliphatic nitrilase